MADNNTSAVGRQRQKAAPDLLAALKRCRESLFHAVAANVDVPGFDPSDHVCIREADAAIAKAEGRTA